MKKKLKKIKIVRKFYNKHIRIHRSFSLNEICKIMKIEVPERFKSIADIKRRNITFDTTDLEEGGIYFAGYFFKAKKEYYEKIVKCKPSVIFIDRERYERFIPDKKYPILVVDNLMEKQGKFFSYLKRKYKVKTLAITGSIGKTTTKQLLNCVVSNEGPTFCEKGNYNTYRAVANVILNKLKKSYKYYIQEIGAFSPFAVEKSAMMIEPDAYILTNIYPHHLNYYETTENVLKDKSSISNHLNKGGTAVINYDDKMLANHKFPHKIITIGIDTPKEVDYRATNIVQNNELLEFDVLHNKKIITHLKVNIVGKHNAYNILGVYALAKWLGFKDENIQKGLSNFETTNIRQNIVNVAGLTVYLDCYNVCEEAVRADLRTLEDMKITKGNQKIAILAPENKLGKDYKKKIYKFAETLKDTKVDHIICYSMSDEKFEFDEDYYGLNSRPLYEGLKDAGFKNVYDINNPNDLMKKIKELATPGDIILIKANWELEIPIAIDKLYGSSISVDYDRKSKLLVSDVVKDKNFAYEVNDIFEDALITEYIGKTTDLVHLVLPEKIGKRKTFKLGNEIFRNKSTIKTIDFGKSIQNIGKFAFSKNTGLEELNIPKNIKYIDQSAFAKCTNLQKVTIEKGLLHISKNAFQNCTKLKEINLPDSIKHIDDNAFTGCENLTIFCNKKGYVSEYLKDKNLKIKYID